MKELSIVKQMVADGQVSQEVAEKYFPELHESDDEKIISAIRKAIEAKVENLGNGVTRTACLAWLEKQDKCETVCHRSHQDANHPNGCIVLEDFNAGEGFYKVHLDYLSRKQVEVIEEMVRTWNNDSKAPDEDIKSCIGMCLTDANEQRFKDYNTSLKDCLAWLEMQGEQKQDPCEHCDNVMLNCHNFPCIKKRAFEQGKYVFEAINEEDADNANIQQRSNDKVEPKFKVGEWIVLTAGELSTTLQIVNVDINKKLYWFNDSSYLPIVDEECLHLWTIKDARDGDVLADEDNNIGIYWGKADDLEWHSYIYLGCDNHLYGFNIGGYHNIKNTKPATKEQRDKLEKAMEEAGYEFDFDKKKLKKIEDKHICELDNSYTCVKFPFKAKVKSSGKIVTISGGQLSPDGREWTKYQSDAEDGYKVYEPNNLELVCEIKQKPVALSEEDEEYDGEDYGIDGLWHAKNILEKTLGKVEGYQTDDGILDHKCAISAVDKLYKQKSAEWSEEDEKRLAELSSILEIGGNFAISDWLKSLKDRIRRQTYEKIKELLTIEFRYHAIPTSEYASESESKKITIGVYDTLEDAIKEGNNVLKELSSRFKFCESFGTHNGVFGSATRLVCNFNGYPQVFCKITQLKYDDIDEVLSEVFNSEMEYKKWDKKQ